jgi:hypothetical protein
MPASCHALGCSPSARATTTGTPPPVAPIGAMTLIRRNRAASNMAVRATPLATPASAPSTSQCGAGAGTPPMRTGTAAAATAAPCPTASTAEGLWSRLSTGPR